MRTTSASIYDGRMEAGIGGEGGGFGKNAIAWLGLGGSVETWRELSQIQPHCFSYLLYIPVWLRAPKVFNWRSPLITSPTLL